MDEEKIRQSKLDKAEAALRKRSLKNSTGMIIVIGYSVDLGKPEVLYSGEEMTLLEKFESLLLTYDEPQPQMPRHAIAAHNGNGFDFNYLAWRAAIHGLHGLARRFRVKHRYQSSPTLIDTALYVDGTLGEAAASVGHTHPSPGGGGNVFDWELEGRRDLTLSHCVDDIEALNAVVKVCLDDELIAPQR
jgi:DNA polymerase elongation subunit (family B)